MNDADHKAVITALEDEAAALVRVEMLLKEEALRDAAEKKEELRKEREERAKERAEVAKERADDAIEKAKEKTERDQLNARLDSLESRITARVDEKMAECMAKMDAMEMPDIKDMPEPPEVDIGPVLSSVAELARAVKELQTREPTPFDLIHHRNELGLLKKTEVVFKKS